MPKPFGDFDDFVKQEEERREVHYSTKVLRAVLKRLWPEEAQQLERGAGDEFGFRWFNSNLADTISIDASKDTVSLPTLVKTVGITKTQLWQTYFDLRSEYGSPFALIFPLPGLGQWVIHDHSGLALLPGYTHIIRRSEQKNAQLTIQPIAAFLDALAGA